MNWPLFGMLLEAETYIPNSFCSSEFKLHMNEGLRPDYSETEPALPVEELSYDNEYHDNCFCGLIMKVLYLCNSV
jgi:hypothetical protein